jgi:hypothetical protein
VDVADVLSGRIAVRQVMALVERLQDEPWSRYRAKLLGGDNWRQHLGWGPSEYLQAALIDVIQVNTAVTAAHGGKRRPKAPEPFYRPEMTPETKVAESLDQIPLDAIAQMINDG